MKEYYTTNKVRKRTYYFKAAFIFLLLVLSSELYLLNYLKSTKGELFIYKYLREPTIDAVAERIEQAILYTLQELNRSVTIVKETKGVYRQNETQYFYTAREINVSPVHSMFYYNYKITQAIKNSLGEIFCGIQSYEHKKNILRITAGYKSIVTHQLILVQSASETLITQQRIPRIALIIDDFGTENVNILNEYLKFNYPLTFAILPGSPNVRQLVSTALRNGHQIILHLPMEPIEYPRVDPGKDAIFINLSRHEIIKRIEHHLKSIPNICGVNVHMGSRATQDPDIMSTLISVLKRKDLFFIDSRTTPYSIGYDIARKTGVKTAKNNIFLDGKRDKQKIIENCWSLAHHSIKTGKAIGIAHVSLITLEVLKKILPELERQGIKIVLVSELVE